MNWKRCNLTVKMIMPMLQYKNILNKFIGIKFSIGCMVWLWCCLIQDSPTMSLKIRDLLSDLFHQTTWSEFFQKVSIKWPGPSQKKMILLFYFRVTTANFWSLLNNLVWIFRKNLYQTTSTIYFSNSRSLEWPGLIVETLEY